MPDTGTTLQGLRAAIDRAGYYPDLVSDAVNDGLGGEQVESHVVHLETTFDAEEVRRHITVLVLTPTRLVVAHTDDHAPEGESGRPFAQTSVESVMLADVSAVVVSRVVADPAAYVPGRTPAEVVLTIGWGAVARIDLEPASCADPECDADHGYTGTSTADDLSLRVSAAADGEAVVARALQFAAALNARLADRA